MLVPVNSCDSIISQQTRREEKGASRRRVHRESGTLCDSPMHHAGAEWILATESILQSSPCGASIAPTSLVKTLRFKECLLPST